MVCHCTMRCKVVKVYFGANGKDLICPCGRLSGCEVRKTQRKEACNCNQGQSSCHCMSSGMPTSSRKNTRCKCKCYKLFFARWNPCYNVCYIFARTFNSRKTMKISFLHFNAKNWSGEGAEVRPNGAEVLLFHLFLEFVNIVFSMCHAMQSSESLLWSISKILTLGLVYAEVVANCAKVKEMTHVSHVSFCHCMHKSKNVVK